MEKRTTPRFGQALALIVILIIIFAGSIIGLGLSPYVPLTLSLLVTMVFAKLHRATWEDIQRDMLSVCKLPWHHCFCSY